ncbi:hypothetical protein DH2020_049472 [Rehmannia glutinosa]|uniref:Protein ENHANCED DISEASE RESISTANCE 2 C-terminal domain-containing protein n=1 Tax=Rehmannia glutinosa TaxID=99300 RepID=A0ABR0U2M3_REHGL
MGLSAFFMASDRRLMAKLEQNPEHEWIERVKSEGSVPLLEPDHCSKGWASPPGDIFMVRGPEYLKTKAKIPGGDYLLKPLGFDWIKGPTKISELLNNPQNRVRRALEDECSKGPKPFVWAFNLQVPSKENYSAEFEIKIDSQHRERPWIVRKAVGEQAICIIGRALTCKYSIGENFIEVDIDIGSSMVASAIVHLAFGYLTTLTVDLVFLIEGQTELELPERILGAVRFSELDSASARQVELPPEGSGNLQSSLPTRFWKSIGQGFTHLIRPGTQESDSNSSASYANANGAADHDTSSRDANKP